MSRLSIRLRLTAVFVAVMSAVLLIIGFFLYFRTRHDLDESINAALRSRQSALRAFATTVGTRATALPPGEAYAQVLSFDGGVLDSRPASRQPLLHPAELARARRSTAMFERHEHARFLAGPAHLGRRPVVVVAGTSLADRERALEGLGGALLVGLPLALLLAAGIAYAVAAAALAPVEAIRRRAETIARAEPGASVPVPEAEDEIHRLAETLNDMLQRLAGAAAHERAFVAEASHELRTPLTALHAELELALRHGGSADELRAAVQRSLHDADRLIVLAEDLLALARADAAPERLRERTDLDALLEEVAEQVRHDPAAVGRTVAVEPSGIVASVDRLALGRALRNLAGNAALHGAGAITLAAAIERAGASAGAGSGPAGAPPLVALTVADEGRIADATVRERAFDRFFRGPGSAGRPGAGLGLALVEAVAAEHGGSAALETAADGTTRAVLRVPLDG